MSAISIPFREDAVVRLAPLRWQTTVSMALLAIAITAVHLFMVLICTGQESWVKAYRSLYCWDSGWYQSIALNGYITPERMTTKDFGNVAFLPAYPFSAHLVHRLTGLDWPYPLLIAAQTACVGFWFYLLVLLRQVSLPAAWTGLAVVLLMLHPAAFFLVAAYTESLFLMSMLGFLYWSQRHSRLAFFLACLHGMVMCATRLVGVTVVLYPLIHAYCNDETVRDQIRRLRPGWSLLRWAMIGGIASLGLGLFFGYCWWRFGAWNLYFKTEKFGWGLVPNYFAFFNRRTLFIAPRFLAGTIYFEPNNLSRYMVPLTILCFIFVGRLEWVQAKQGGQGWRQRLGYYVAAALMFYINVAGRDCYRQMGMIRYVFVIEALMLLAALPLIYRTGWFKRVPRWGKIGGLVAMLCLSVLGQITYVYLFAHGEWVA